MSLILFRNDLDFRKLHKISRREWFLLLFRAFTYYVVGVTLFSQAIILTKYSNVSFIGAIPMTAIYGFILLKEKATLAKVALIVLAFVGVLLISVRDYSNIFSWGYGEVLALISTVSYSLCLVTRKWHSNLLNNKEITQITFFLALILLFITSFFFGEGLPLAHWTWGLVIAVAGAGLFNVANMFLTKEITY